jgi:GNAT superfamily N-acetyltransferase
MIRIIDGQSPEVKYLDYQECAYIHSNLIPNGFLPSLGINFLAGLYESFSISKHSFLMLAIENEKVLGFIAVSFNTNKFFKWYIATQIYKHVFKIPFKILGKTFFKKILDLLTYPYKNKSSSEGFISNSEIFNFCVTKEIQGKGVGKLLFSNAVSRLENQNIETLKIVTGGDQKTAHNFYNKVGAILSGETTIHDSENSLVFSYKMEK